MKKEKKKNKLTITDKLLNIYKLFNVECKHKELSELNKKDLYLVLLMAIDNHDDADPIVLHNFKNYAKEINDIYDLQDDYSSYKEISFTPPELKELSDLTNNEYISTDDLVDKNGNIIPEPYNKSEIRTLKINGILK